MGRKAEDITGQRFGRLTVISRATNPRSPGNGYAYWRCRCDCGEMHTVRGASLRDGTSTRCKFCAYGRMDPTTRERLEIQLWCTNLGEKGGFARVLDPRGDVVARTHLSRVDMKIRRPHANSPHARRCMLALEHLGKVRMRNASESFRRWAEHAGVRVAVHQFTPADELQRLWFESVHAPTLESLTDDPKYRLA